MLRPEPRSNIMAVSSAAVAAAAAAAATTGDLWLDPAIRNWVLLPIMVWRCSCCGR